MLHERASAQRMVARWKRDCPSRADGPEREQVGGLGRPPARRSRLRERAAAASASRARRIAPPVEIVVGLASDGDVHGCPVPRLRRRRVRAAPPVSGPASPEGRDHCVGEDARAASPRRSMKGRTLATDTVRRPISSRRSVRAVAAPSAGRATAFGGRGRARAAASSRGALDSRRQGSASRYFRAQASFGSMSSGSMPVVPGRRPRPPPAARKP